MPLDHLTESRRVPAFGPGLGGDRPGSRLLAVGAGVGEASVTGVARYVSRPDQLALIRPGEIVMAEATGPAWEAGLAHAGGIVVNDVGPLCHAEAIARKFEIPAVIAAGGGASPLWSGATVTLAVAEGGIGRLYQELSPAAAGGRERSWPTGPRG